MKRTHIEEFAARVMLAPVQIALIVILVALALPFALLIGVLLAICMLLAVVAMALSGLKDDSILRKIKEGARRI